MQFIWKCTGLCVTWLNKGGFGGRDTNAVLGLKEFACDLAKQRWALDRVMNNAGTEIVQTIYKPRDIMLSPVYRDEQKSAKSVSH